MAWYQVRVGKQLPHNGQLLEAGELVELPRHVGEDSIVRDFVKEVDEAGNPILAPVEPHGLERYRPHEQVTLLEARLAEAKSRVETLTRQIATARAAADPIATQSAADAETGAVAQEE